MYQNIPQQPSEVPVSPEKTNGLAVLPVTQKQPRSRKFLIRGAAAALSLCLLGGAAGAGTVWCAWEESALPPDRAPLSPR